MRLLCSVAIAGMLIGCSQEKPTTTNHGKLEEAWNRANDPTVMGYDYLAHTYNYITKMDDLPLSGRLSKTPWSDDYWATSRGGISYRWVDDTVAMEKRFGYSFLNYFDINPRFIPYMSPSEKYDLVTDHKDFLLTRKERTRTKVLRTIPGSPEYDPNFEIPFWEGLCHGWAPAALLFDNPAPVSMMTPDKRFRVDFGSSDIKALLTYFLHSTPSTTHFLGARCELDFGQLQQKLHRGEITAARYREYLNQSECRDTNAGAFHIVLTNQISRMNEGFVMDKTTDSQVWNQPVYGYATKILGRYTGASQGAAPGTVQEIDVETVVKYIQEIGPSWKGIPSPNAHNSVTYKYRLEIDQKGMIIGGDWYSNGTKDDRPDFLWKRDLPEFTKDFKVLEKLYLASRPIEAE